MKKLLLLLILSFFSNQSLANLGVYSCEIKQYLFIYEDGINEKIYEPSSFLFKEEDKKLIFDKDFSKRPRIIDVYEIDTTFSYEHESFINIFAHDDVLLNQYNFQFSKEKDYGYLTITKSIGFGSIDNLIAKCTAL
mgnify:CR=1 FL=1